MSASLIRRVALALTVAFTIGANALAEPVRILSDVAYKSNAKTEYERERCKLDLYLPQPQEPFPTLVWFHGGGLKNGHKADGIAVGVAKRFSSRGVAVASVNYRLSDRVKYPAYIEDAAAAVTFVRQQIGKYGGSEDLVFVSGHSAGGYLAAMLGMDPRYLGRHQLKPAELAGFIPISGQMITHSTVRAERGIPRVTPIIDEAAPAYHARAETAPFLCIVGNDDRPARAEENQYFVAAMKAAGHKRIEILQFPQRDHGTIASRMNETDDAVALAIERFVDRISRLHGE